MYLSSHGGPEENGLGVAGPAKTVAKCERAWMNAEWVDDHPGAVVTAGGGEGLADFNHDSVLRVFPVGNYQKR